MAERKRGPGVGIYERPVAADRTRRLRQLAPWLAAALVLLGLVTVVLLL